MTTDKLLADYVIALADDELVIGQRDSEWTGHAPILEEDIAFANIALDEIGHAVVWYEVAAKLLDEDPDTYPDSLAYFRDPPQFRNVQFVELPRGDWGFTIIRQYLWDVYEITRYEAMIDSTHKFVSEAAAKIRGEEFYHLRHSAAWAKRLGLGTEESNTRMQKALDALWPYALQLFQPLGGEPELVEAHNLPSGADLFTTWEGKVRALLTESNLTIPEGSESPVQSRADYSEHRVDLITELQKVARLDPDATW